MRNSKIISVAPMMDWTDSHCRYFMRLLNPNILLYSEMITAEALLYGNAKKYLHFNNEEHPIALQLGGSDPCKLKQSAILAEDEGYDEVNLNIGCPSERVQKGSFGACLMAEPNLVADCVDGMTNAVEIPISVKTRIGIDNNDSYEFLSNFIKTVSEAKCSKFIIHARKAILSGLSPKDNRSIPPLNYERVFQIKSDFEHLSIILNGGIKTIDDCKDNLKKLDGVMIGRHAYHNPWFLHELKSLNESTKDDQINRDDIIERMYPYIQDQLNKGTQLNHITRHMLGLYKNEPGARSWRRYLSTHAHHSDAGIEVLQNALKILPKVA